MTDADTHPVLLFDGECNLCNGTVQFIIERDPEARFRFASLQSETGRKLLEDHGAHSDLDTVILIDEDRLYERSSAVLQTLRHLGGPWVLALLFWVIPSPIRDWFYDRIAKRRYDLFGRRESCMIPTGDTRRRFLSYDEPRTGSDPT